jgi:N-methylhydantoinase B
MGARPSADGLSAVHTHMTNSLNTPAEALEQALPVRLTRYALRRGSGGAGRRRGGDGLVREFEFLGPVECTLIAERRVLAPWGLRGGRSGRPGVNRVRVGPAADWRRMEGRFSLRLPAGSALRVETPGGGGWGAPRRRARGRHTGRGGTYWRNRSSDAQEGIRQRSRVRRRAARTL